MIAVSGFFAHLYKSHCEFQGEYKKIQHISEVITSSTTEELAEMFVSNEENEQEWILCLSSQSLRELLSFSNLLCEDRFNLNERSGRKKMKWWIRAKYKSKLKRCVSIEWIILYVLYIENPAHKLSEHVI